MRIDQRNNGASGTALGYTVDRWIYGNTLGRGTWGRNLNAIGGPVGFPYYLGFQSSSAYVTPATEVYVFDQTIEADFISDFAFGTVNAQPVTLSFWVNSSLSGTFGGSLMNYAASRSYPFTFNIPTSNTWTKIAITIPGDTAGTWVMSGNGGSLIVFFDLGAGASRRGPANAWAATNYYGATGSQSVVSVNGGTFYLTGVKLEVGSVATPFPRPTMAKALADCQRYYQVLGGNMLVSGYGSPAGALLYGSLSFLTAMRATPTVAYTGANYGNMSGIAINSAAANVLVSQATVTAAGIGWAVAIASLSAEL
jgi:hypothetical protein